jgi:hypothetical protein
MSSVAFGTLATRREQSDSGTSTTVQPPGLSTYVDVLVALVPAEVLAINAMVVTLVTKTAPGGGTEPTDPATLRLAFWLLLGLSGVLYALGRQQSLAQAGRPQGWVPEDVLRFLIPPAAFTGWVLLNPASAWSSVVPGMSSGTRVLIGVVGATALAALTKVLATRSDLMQPPAQAIAEPGEPPVRQDAGHAPPAGQPPTPDAPAPVPAQRAPGDASDAQAPGPAVPQPIAVTPGANPAAPAPVTGALTEANPPWIADLL